MKCPRCRRGHMFKNSNPWKLKKVFDMPTHCEECGQQFELEVGFWYGTGYVSYALSVAMSVASFVAWYVLIGMSTKDNRFFWNFIPYLSDVEKMGIHQAPVAVFARSSYAAQCYSDLWQEIKEGVLE